MGFTTRSQEAFIRNEALYQLKRDWLHTNPELGSVLELALVVRFLILSSTLAVSIGIGEPSRYPKMNSSPVIRKSSSTVICGYPLYHIAMGGDIDSGEMRGHAKGIIAIGDLATGVIAIGGLARGFIAIGGLAVGVLSLGGLSIGLLALGGAAIGGISIGGGALGVVAIGGGSVGYYAMGGGAVGGHVLSAIQQDPEAVGFFQKWFSWLPSVRQILG